MIKEAYEAGQDRAEAEIEKLGGPIGRTIDHLAVKGSDLAKKSRSDMASKLVSARNKLRTQGQSGRSETSRIGNNSLEAHVTPRGSSPRLILRDRNHQVLDVDSPKNVENFARHNVEHFGR